MFVDGPKSCPLNEGGPYGYLRCEGSGTLILRRLVDAEASGQRVVAKILRAVQAHAGPKEGSEEGPGRVYQAPSGYGMKRMFERAYLSIGVPLDRVKYMGEPLAWEMSLRIIVIPFRIPHADFVSSTMMITMINRDARDGDRGWGSGRN